MVQQMVHQYRLKLDALMESIVFTRPFDRVNQYKQHLDDIITQLKMHVTNTLKLNRKSLEGLVGKLETLSPKAVLERGYTLTIKLPAEELVRTVKEVSKGDKIKIIVKDGEIECEVVKIRQNEDET